MRAARTASKIRPLSRCCNVRSRCRGAYGVSVYDTSPTSSKPMTQLQSYYQGDTTGRPTLDVDSKANWSKRDSKDYDKVVKTVFEQSKDNAGEGHLHGHWALMH